MTAKARYDADTRNIWNKRAAIRGGASPGHAPHTLRAHREGRARADPLAAMQREVTARESHVCSLQEALEILRAGHASQRRLDDLESVVDEVWEGASPPSRHGVVGRWNALQLLAA